MSRKHLSVVGATSALLVFVTLVSGSEAAESSAELPSGTMQAKATTACTECHDARIILQQRLGKTAWTKEMDKMVKWGAVVDPGDRDALIEYFSANFPPEKAAYIAARSKANRSARK
jgi:hypothetical protein